VTIFIPRNIVGFDRDIIVDDDKIVLSSDVEKTQDMWHLGEDAYRSISRIGAATSRPIIAQPKDPRIAWWSEYSSDQRYDYILGKKLFSENTKRIIAECKNLRSAIVATARGWHHHLADGRWNRHHMEFNWVISLAPCTASIRLATNGE
jgi:hypothetical protein